MVISFVFDTLGIIVLDVVEILNRVQRIMDSNIITPKSIDVVIKRVTLSPKGLVAQHIESFPSTSVYN